MKTRFIITAALTALLIVSFTPVPVQAQRRSSRNEVTQSKNEKKKEKTEAKTTIVDKNSKKRRNLRATSSRTGRTSTRLKRDNSAAKSSAHAVSNRANSNARERITSSKKQPYENQQPNSVQRRKPQSNRSNLTNASQRNQRESFRSNGSARYSSSHKNAVSSRARNDHKQKLYRIDTKDNRYLTTKNFRGNKNHWKAGYAKHHVHYKKHNEYYYKNYDHRKYRHWNNHWENYRWNVNSWRDYYSGYHPHSYRFHKHYFYHPAYGHVIRKFGFKPEYFIHNHIRYYTYNGHFFRRFPGVGYILTDMPFGVVFHKLPRYAERASINGFLYFRVGNLFFEKNPHGFALIHYPERYHALDADFYNEGYYREVDFYIYQ